MHASKMDNTVMKMVDMNTLSPVLVAKLPTNLIV